MSFAETISDLKRFVDIHGNKVKVSRITKMPQGTLRKFCRGESDPRLSTIMLILDAKNQIEKGPKQ